MCSTFPKIITLAKTQQLGQPVQYDEADIILVLQPPTTHEITAPFPAVLAFAFYIAKVCKKLLSYSPTEESTKLGIFGTLLR